MTINISKLHLELLDKKRLILLNKITPFAVDSFILGGGTALSLQIAHRKSFDFDFFSEKEIQSNLLSKISKLVDVKTVSVNNTDELTIFDVNNIKVTFLFYYFKKCFKPIEINNGLKLFDIKDIAVQKAHTIGRRGEYRDYFDLYTLLKDKYIKLDELIDLAEKNYKNLFNSKLFLQQLVYFDDLISFDIIPVANERLSKKKEVKEYFEKTIREYLKND